MNRYGSFALLLFSPVVAAVLAAGPASAAERKVTRFARFEVDGKVAYGLVEGDRVRQIEGDLFGRWKPTEETHALAEVKLLVPTVPTKVLACAGNYKSHLGGAPPHPYPELFSKVPSCLIACGEEVVIPKGTAEVHHEGEMVIVIGKRAKNVPKERALDYVLGVTCGNDISARDWQKADVQWWRAKGSDTFGPCGPWIASGIDYDNLHLELRVNGEVRQEERTSNMEHGVASIVSWASRHVTLEPGDLIFTGTPGKTTAIKPGDVMEVELEGVGTLRNTVRAAE
jgi:2-keto-4-pentenoate hydratase/2-oxohepta-3-ene-1,7-dioic acid hydratase in catechol pathway